VSVFPYSAENSENAYVVPRKAAVDSVQQWGFYYKNTIAEFVHTAGKKQSRVDERAFPRFGKSGMDFFDDTGVDYILQSFQFSGIPEDYAAQFPAVDFAVLPQYAFAECAGNLGALFSKHLVAQCVGVYYAPACFAKYPRRLVFARAVLPAYTQNH